MESHKSLNRNITKMLILCQVISKFNKIPIKLGGKEDQMNSLYKHYGRTA